MPSPTTSGRGSSLAAPPEAAAPPRAFAPSASRRALALANRFATPLTFVVLLIVWEMACRLFRVPAFLLPAPSMIVAGFREQAPSIWLTHLWATLHVAIIGYLVAIAVSITARSRCAEARSMALALKLSSMAARAFSHSPCAV